MTSWTSPRASASGLPTSRVTVRASASSLASTRRPTCWTARPRTGAGVAAQAAWAARARPQASTKVAWSPEGDRRDDVAPVGGVAPLDAAAGGPGRGPSVEQGGEVGHASTLPARGAAAVLGRSTWRTPGATRAAPGG